MVREARFFYEAGRDRSGRPIFVFVGRRFRGLNPEHVSNYIWQRCSECSVIECNILITVPQTGHIKVGGTDSDCHEFWHPREGQGTQ